MLQEQLSGADNRLELAGFWKEGLVVSTRWELIRLSALY